MKTEKEKMMSSELYNPLDQVLVEDRLKARLLLQKLNGAGEDEITKRRSILDELLPRAISDITIQPPFFCDYGYNIKAGNQVYFNFNCVVLDVAEVTIGDRTLIGPNVQIYTATHPMKADERATGLESAIPIEIGQDVWIAGGAVLCPGVRIGDRSVIGAGSVVTRDIPCDVFAAGNPCRVIRDV